ncbi:hypothetical protein J2X57_002879 [Luteibacter sp. 1214]|nr:hypothetical protein [Luteibacter sp. 1214]
MTEVIGRELAFVATRIPFQWTGHDAGAVDEDMQRFASCDEASGESVDGRRIGQVHGFDDDVQAVQCLSCLGEVPCGDDNAGAGGTEGPAGLGAYAGVAAGDDGGLAGEVDAGQHVVGGGGGGKSSSHGALRGRHGMGSCGVSQER